MAKLLISSVIGSLIEIVFIFFKLALKIQRSLFI